ncbi:gamma-glutamyl hydrolase isoform X2 [Nematostella vectensis]|uniref:gamma-glutamyl hydrolase isoform X2 n=1 Tax=Nematostella vectensis TaxID=45351 RepID=UPI00138FCD55|nr:gamma-glutamyl hydrolase isoform X2 [Nematostella vectensis]
MPFIRELVVILSLFFVGSAKARSIQHPTRDGLYTNRPIIGILAHDIDDDIIKKYGKSFIPASYVKYLESAGARVVPIRDNLTSDELKSLFLKINGVLFPGGDSDLWKSGYARTGAAIFDLAMEANDNGDVFPLWGTCLGFQLLHVRAAKGKDVLTKCSGENVSLPLNFTDGYKDSRMFRNAHNDVTQDMAKLGVTLNMHVNCVTVETYEKESSLSSFFKKLSTNMDKDDKVKFVSTVEGLKYPLA